jgi:hypothetical protein
MDIKTDTPAAQAPAATVPRRERIRIYEHSNILYWWVVWAYGYFCALLSFLNGHKVQLVEDRSLYVYSHAWLGLSFAALLLVVILVTNVKAKGVYSVVLLLCLLVLGGLIHMVVGWRTIFHLIPLLLIFMNLAFYVFVATGIFIIWLAITFGVDRMNYWDFTAGQLTRVRRIGDGAHTYDTRGMVVERVPDDILINKILGLWFLGLGTADLKITTAGASRESFEIQNVWRASTWERRIGELIAIKPVS